MSLIAHNCDINAKDADGCTALHHIARTASGVESILLDATCLVDVQDNNGNTPLILAAIEGFDEVIRRLILRGANANLVNNFGKAALHYLAMKNHWQAIHIIAASRADVNVTTRRGKTPLWYAVNNNRPEAVKTLLIANCTPEVVTIGCDAIPSPVEVALNKGLYEIAKLLTLAGCAMGPVSLWLKRVQVARSLHELEGHTLQLSQLPQGHNSGEEALRNAIGWFEEWMSKPHSLLQICRISLRRYLGMHAEMKISSLPLPSAVRDFLTLTEIRDHYVKGFLM